MKQTSVILLLFLLLLPITWNSISLFHHLVEHTSTFCNSDTKHSHPSSDNCLSIFQLSESHSQSQLPVTTESEYQEIKQYLTSNLESSQRLILSFQQKYFITLPLPDDDFPKDVFHPPIFS